MGNKLNRIKEEIEMQIKKMQIEKETYDDIIKECKGGHLNMEWVTAIFSESIIYGYGLYGADAKRIGDEYIIEYCIGDSCD